MSEPQPKPVASELKRLVAQSSHYLTALLINLALGFVSFPIYTRVFSVADFGTIDLVQKIFLLLTAVAKLGQQNSALRFFNRDLFKTDPNKEKSYYSTLYLGIIGLGGVVTLLFVGVLAALPSHWIPSALSGMLIFASSLVLFRAMQSMLWSFLRIEEKTGTYNVVNVIMRALSIVAILLAIPLLGASIHTYYTATIAVEFLVVLTLTIPLLRRGVLELSSFDRTFFKTAILFGSPLVVQELAGIILDAGDRILIQIYLGADPLGFYSVAYGLSSYVNTLMITPLGLAILPIYMRIWNTDGREKTIEFLSAGLDFFFMVAALLFTLVCVCSQDAVVLLASAKYRGADLLIPTLVAGLLVYTAHIFTTAGLVIEGKTKILATTLLASAGLNVALNMVLLPWIGLSGAAIATLVSYAFCAYYQARVAFRVLPLNLGYRSAFNYFLAAVGAWLAASAIHLARPVAELFLRAAVATAVYIAILLFLDRRIRQWIGLGWSYLLKLGPLQRFASVAPL